jgi:hypothetical protein
MHAWVPHGVACHAGLCCRAGLGWVLELTVQCCSGAAQLITEKFPWFLDTYKAYPHNIQRADVLRYFVLYEFGGIYLVSAVHRAVGCVQGSPAQWTCQLPALQGTPHASTASPILHHLAS